MDQKPPGLDRARFGLRNRRHSEALIGYLFVAPAFLGLLLFYIVPTFRAFEISLTDWNMLRPSKFIGFANYQKLLGDANFWESLRLALVYVLWNIPLQTVLALLLAVLSDRLARSVAIRAILIAPYLISKVVATMIWLLMLDPLLGMTNAFLSWTGLAPQPFLASPDQALISVAGISIWQHTGFNALLFYAGLQNIPRNLYEAARIDGVNERQMFWNITLPLLRPVMVFVLVTSVIGSFQLFDVVAVGTAGGPANSTRVILWYIYENAFKFNKMGYASALSMTLFAILMLVTLLQMRLLRGNSSELSS